MKTFICLFCGTENRWCYSSHNKFCDSACKAKHRWEFETKPRIERGEATSNSIAALKRYLVERDGNKCAECFTPSMWQGKSLTLHLEHIDGDSENNHLANLKLLCPNCHSQTPTFGNKGRRQRADNSKRKKYYTNSRTKTG